jgi:glutamyl-tRNA synthetase
MVRTRFAPSPTGYLHVGGLRTALYNYLFTKKNKGAFILRIEDTDQTRYVEGAKENLLSTLQKIGLKYDEGPFLQSERTEIYKKHADELIEKGHAYLCFCTPERLEEMRKRQEESRQATMYDRTCLHLSDEERKEKIKKGTPYVVRQKIPHGEKLRFKDLIRKTVTFDTLNIDDQILVKSDGFPTYHLANVVDDHLMGITHVIRGEEWLPSTPKHILLYRAFGWETPEFAHIPLLLNKDKSKLSKRQGHVSVEYFLDAGFTKEAIINYIALLGWHPGKGAEQEIFSLDELVESFSIEQVHKSGAIFDEEKFSWFNYRWGKRLHQEELAKQAKKLDSGCRITKDNKGEPVYSFSSPQKEKNFMETRAKMLLRICGKYLPKEWSAKEILLQRAVITVEEKILKDPKNIKEYIDFYFQPDEFGEDLLLNDKMKVDRKTAKKALEESLKTLEKLPDFNSMKKIQDALIAKIQELGLKNGQVLWPLRVALTGKEFSPGTFELLWALSKEESLKRIKDALSEHVA